MKRISFFLMAIALAAFATVWLVGRCNSSAPAAPPTQQVDEIVANGIVEGATPEVALRPEVSGTIRVIAFRENEHVSKGEVLVELENDVQKQQVAVARAEWTHAEAELDKVKNGERAEKRLALAAQTAARQSAYEQAQKQMVRAEKLMRASAMSREDYDAAQHLVLRTKEEWKAAAAEQAVVDAPPRQDDLDAAVARVTVAKARWNLAKAELAKTQIRAPSDGCILQVFAEPGDQAGPATSRPVVMFADLSKLSVRTFVEELDAPRVQLGQKVVVTVDGLPGKTFKGAVKLVLQRMGKRAPHTDNPGEYHDVYFREVRVDLENGDNLVLGMRTVARIALGR